MSTCVSSSFRLASSSRWAGRRYAAQSSFFLVFVSDAPIVLRAASLHCFGYERDYRAAFYWVDHCCTDGVWVQ